MDVSVISGESDLYPRHWNDWVLGCVNTPGTCMDDIIIEAPGSGGATKRNALVSLNQAIATSKQAVRDFFNTQQGEVLVDIFGIKNFTNLKNGTFTMLRHYNQNENTDFYLIGDYNNLNLSNPTVVIPIIINE